MFMKKLLIFVLLLCAFAGYAQTGYAVIAAEDVNFRKMPETSSDVIRMVKLGTLAKVLEGPVMKSNKNWYKLQIGNQVGWIAADYVFELYPISDIYSNFPSSIYTIFVAVESNLKEARASGMLFEMVNFIVLSEDLQLSQNSKVYPVRVKPDANMVMDGLTYRDKYLSLNPFLGASTILYFNNNDNGIGAFVISYNGFTHSAVYSLELVTKFSEGVFQADIKHYYSSLIHKD